MWDSACQSPCLSEQDWAVIKFYMSTLGKAKNVVCREYARGNSLFERAIVHWQVEDISTFTQGFDFNRVASG